MNRVKLFFAKRFFKELFQEDINLKDKSGNTGGGAGRELASEFVKYVVYKENNDTEFEDPDFELEDIQAGYNTDSYIRQGVDKYVDQIFKEGYSFYGTDPTTVEYLNLRLAYIAEATSTPTQQFLMDIAEDIVKYGNCMVVKARANDPNAFPQGQNLTGLYGKDPIAGYFCANPVHMKVQRDDHGVIKKWQQDNDGGTQEFNPEDVVHFYYKREKGNAYGTSFLVPVLNDVRALRQAEENVLKMMYRNIYPFFHIAVGTEDATGTSAEVDALKTELDGMDVEGSLVTTERVTIKPIASDKVIQAEPYLKYMESRVFSGFGIPEILWGRGDTSNRSTGDNMTSEMADRIRAMSKTIEMFFNEFIIKELLMEGGYDPVLNPDQKVEFRFNDNDVDVEIKKQVHSIYKYEHSAITEDEMREDLGMDPIPDGDREKMFVELVTRETLRVQAELDTQVAKATNKENGTAETNNKSKNQGGSGNKKTKNFIEAPDIGLVADAVNSLDDWTYKYIIDHTSVHRPLIQEEILQKTIDCGKEILYIIARDRAVEERKAMADFIIGQGIRFANGLHDDLSGTSPYHTSQDSFIGIMDLRMDIYRGSIMKFVKDYDASLLQEGDS